MTRIVMTRLFLALTLALGACATDIDPTRPVEHVQPLQGSEIVQAGADYAPVLACLADHVDAQSFPAPRISVGHITDMTGADDYFNGRRMTQGATLMAMSALDASGIRLIERYDMGISQIEMGFSETGLLRDSPETVRALTRGQVQGSDLYLVGGITEYNPNIRSSADGVFASTPGDTGGAVSFGSSDYIIDIGIDLRLIDVRSTEVVAIRSLRKQVRGREVEAGVFAFLDGSVIDIGGGQRALEPVQTAIRSMIELAVADFIRDLYGLPTSQCDRDTTALQANATPPTPAAPATPTAMLPDASVASPAQLEQGHAASAYGIHLASYATATGARFGWVQFGYRFPSLLEHRHGRVQTVDLPATDPFVRLTAGPWASASHAEAACMQVRERGAFCQVTEFAGEPVG